VADANHPDFSDWGWTKRPNDWAILEAKKCQAQWFEHELTPIFQFNSHLAVGLLNLRKSVFQ
jgi:hypothetical protein